MSRMDAMTWVVRVCSLSLCLSHAKTLCVLLASAMRCHWVTLANLGRSMLGTAKHPIKRAWRFCANKRIETTDAMRPIIARLRRKPSKKKKLLIALDWVDIKGAQTLVASIVLNL